ncbi:hypothetical protein CO612_09120 [Lysobacteraceae bacterium NML71-0210]|nr:hypothetical protein CO612_09120 [Xanthomonadaceae bacterium NML71-0210]
MKQARKTPGGYRGQYSRASGLGMWGVYQNPGRLPRDWRANLPSPERYYRARVERLGKPNGQGWAQGRCPLHQDRHESLSVNFQHGGWRCFAGCGHGDMVSFHERLTGKGFAEAARDLMEGRQ